MVITLTDKVAVRGRPALLLDSNILIESCFTSIESLRMNDQTAKLHGTAKTLSEQ